MVQKSGQPVDIVNIPFIYRVLYIPSGPAFLPSTACHEDMTSHISTFDLDSFDLTGASNLVRNLC